MASKFGPTVDSQEQLFAAPQAAIAKRDGTLINAFYAPRLPCP
ncbi:hypothetical protein PDR5_20580 [Pseudomonas sp. DR 5-09]|nr:hypothetical protein PDR5_20580 [Pseudomonas sp. DR 5-09]